MADSRPRSTPIEEVTALLDAAASGHSDAADRLLPLIYDQLRALARARMAGERPGHTLQATALVHEAYLRLVGAENQRPPDLDPETARRTLPEGHWLVAVYLLGQSRLLQATERHAEAETTAAEAREILQAALSARRTNARARRSASSRRSAMSSDGAPKPRRSTPA